MSHISEYEFHKEYVEPLLFDQFGEENVEHEKWLPITTAFADFWVDTGLVILAIEVENDRRSIRSGVAQAQEYALNDSRAVPVVITPEDHLMQDQVEALRSICPIIEIPTDEQQ